MQLQDRPLQATLRIRFPGIVIDLDGNIVPDGAYTVWVEFTDKHAQGPLYEITFNKGPNAEYKTPADETYFKDIELAFTPYVAEFAANTTEVCDNEEL